MTRIRAVGLVCAGLALALNLLIEKLLIAAKANKILIPGLLDFTPTWNRGVSFGLLWQNGDTGRYVLIAVLIVIVIGVATLIWKAANSLTAIGYGLIVGGALGNLLDRTLYSGVFDYLFLHIGRVSLFVFNFSDFAIAAGVVLLAADALAATASTPLPDSRR